MNALYDYLVKNKIKTISDHALSRWDKGHIQRLKDEKLLKAGKLGTSIYCDECGENCPIHVYDIVDIPGKGQEAAFTCSENEEMGFITTSLSRRRQWSFMRPTKRKKASKLAPKEISANETPDKEQACFVFLENGIAFFSKSVFRKLPFQPDSHVFKLLPKFIDGSMTSREVQEYSESKDKPRSIIQNINKSILSRIQKAQFTHINCSKFVYYDNSTQSYKIKFPIITHEQYKVLKARLDKTYYGG